MGLVSKILFLLFSINIIIACGPVHNSTGGSASTSLGENSADIYSKTVLPIINDNNCALCHDGGTNAAPFAVSNANQSQNTLLNFGLINFNTPSSSKIVTTIEASHNGIPTEVASELSLAIEDWLSQMSDSEDN